MAVRPLLINSSKKRVGFLKSTAVRALPIEMVAPIAKVPSRRSSAIKFPPSSTTAITPPGALFFFAYSTAAAIAFFAPSRLIDFFSTIWAWVLAPTVIITAMIVPVEIFIKFLWGVRFAVLAGYLLGPARAALVLFDRVLEGGFAEICLSKRAPDLNLGDVGHVFGHRDLTVHLVAFDRQFLQQISVPFRIDDLPMRVGSIGSLEIIGKS